MADLYYRTATLYGKAEASYGVEPSPVVAGSNAILTSGLTITPIESSLVSRDTNQPYFGARQQLYPGIAVRVSFMVEYVGGGTQASAPAYGFLLDACRMTGAAGGGSPLTTYAYNPHSSDTVASANLKFQIGTGASTVQHVISGARGTWGFELRRGQIPKFSFEFVGIYNTPTDVTALTPSWTSYQTPVPVTNDNTPTASIHSVDVELYEFTFAKNNQLNYLNIPNREEVVCMGGEAGGLFTINAPLMATKNWFSAATASTLGALSLVHGAAASPTVNKTLTFASSRLQILNPTYQESDTGFATIQANYILVPSSSGNDEFTLTQS